MSFTFESNADRAIAQWSAKQVRIPQAMAKVVTLLTLKLLAAVQARAPVLTGKLRRSIFQEIVVNPVETTGRVYVDATTSPYNRFMEYGTKPHDIYPTKAKALAFMVGGKQVFAAHVKHPGTKPYLYVHGPFEEMRPEIIAKIEGAGREALQ